MPMMQAILLTKKSLTHDVFELTYQASESKNFVAGQFITFILPGIGGRAYSILAWKDNIFTLIIKRWSQQMWGRGGSIALCDAKIWESFQAVWPSWHFTLKENQKNKCFIGTGTGLVPLYSQLLFWLLKNPQMKFTLIFWVRTHADLYYVEQIENLKNMYPENFSYTLYVSREEANECVRQWYVTDRLSPEFCSDFEEYYLCGAPSMIAGAQEKLLELWISVESIFFEKYT